MNTRLFSTTVLHRMSSGCFQFGSSVNFLPKSRDLAIMNTFAIKFMLLAQTRSNCTRDLLTTGSACYFQLKLILTTLKHLQSFRCLHFKIDPLACVLFFCHTLGQSFPASNYSNIGLPSAAVNTITMLKGISLL